MADLVKEFEAWLEIYEGNIIEFKHKPTGIPYIINLSELRTDIDDGMYEVELSNGSQQYIASNRICIVDGMVVLETLKKVINESMDKDHFSNFYEGVRLKNGILQLNFGT